MRCIEVEIDTLVNKAMMGTNSLAELYDKLCPKKLRLPRKLKKQVKKEMPKKYKLSKSTIHNIASLFIQL